MTPWSAQEDAILASMLGSEHKEMGRALPHRSIHAIGTRVRRTHDYRVRTYNVSPYQPTALPRITIPLADLASHYAIGWRVADFAGGVVTMEWRPTADVRWVG